MPDTKPSIDKATPQGAIGEVLIASATLEQLRTQNAALREALEDLIHQLPTDERLADFNLDKAERALEETKST